MLEPLWGTLEYAVRLFHPFSFAQLSSTLLLHRPAYAAGFSASLLPCEKIYVYDPSYLSTTLLSTLCLCDAARMHDSIWFQKFIVVVNSATCLASAFTYILFYALSFDIDYL